MECQCNVHNTEYTQWGSCHDQCMHYGEEVVHFIKYPGTSRCTQCAVCVHKDVQMLQNDVTSWWLVRSSINIGKLENCSCTNLVQNVHEVTDQLDIFHEV